MKERPAKSVAASVRQRLLNLSRDRNEPFDLVLVRYGLERFLYRIGISPFAKNFMLKGALLFLVWGQDDHRPTRDADLLAAGSNDLREMEETFKKICAITGDDGIVFDAGTVRAQEIAEEKAYTGIRVNFIGRLDGAKIPMQFDIGFGDAVTPGPESIEYPVLLDFPSPTLRAYPVYTVVSEKLHAMVLLGMQNSRMKDFYDTYVMCRAFEFDGPVLSDAISATFERRKTRLPEGVPVALTGEFADSQPKKTQWQAFIRRNRLPAQLTLAEAIAEIHRFVMPVVEELIQKNRLASTWNAGGPWMKT